MPRIIPTIGEPVQDADDSLLRCRVCGYVEPDNPRWAPWGADGQDPSWDICPCCGVEFGYEDTLESAAMRFRRLWIERGAPWRDPSLRPQGWSLEDQLSRAPAIPPSAAKKIDITEQVLAALDALSKKSDPPPWNATVIRTESGSEDSFIRVGMVDAHGPNIYVTRGDGPAAPEVLRFIANARNMMPLLVDEIRRLRAQLALADDDPQPRE